MRLVKKFLSIALLSFVMVISLFSLTACNLITTDKEAYYNQVVATFKYNNKTINVSMTELNDAFKNYGYNRLNQGYYESVEDCINDSLKYHIQRELFFNEIATKLSSVYAETNNELYNLSFVDLENYSWNKTLENIYESTNPNALEIRYNAFQSIQANVDSFVEQILEEDDLLGNVEEETKPEPIRPEKEEYDSRINIIDEIVTYKNEQGEDLEKRVLSIEKDIEEIFVFGKTDVNKHYALVYNYDEVAVKKGYNKYIKALQQTAKSEGRSTKVDDVLLVEEQYNIKNEYQRKLLSLYQYWYESNLNITVSDVLDYYKNQFDSQKDIYEYDIDAYRTAMEKYNSNYVYYHNNAGNEYIAVSHILINFTNEQKFLIAELDKEYEANKKIFANNPTQLEKLENDYNKELNSIIINTKSKFVVDGEEKEDYIGNIISEITTYVAENGLEKEAVMSSAEVIAQKSKNFEDMMYKYNDDPGIMNSDFYYTVNVNDGVKTNWEEAFTQGARELYKNYSQGDVLLRPAVSSYGIHIMFYSEVIDNVVNPNAINSLSVEDLVDKKVNTASDKTMFEYVYDIIAEDNYYNNYVSSVITQHYNKAEIKVDSYKFENLWK